VNEVVSAFLDLLNFLRERAHVFIESLGECAIAGMRQCEVLGDGKPNFHSHSVHKNPAMFNVCGHKQAYDLFKLQFQV
jgi:hypothetical protein